MANYEFFEQLNKALPDEKLVVNILKQVEGFENFKHKVGQQHVSDAYDAVEDEWLEIKVDYTSYPNHFVERYSSLESKSNGGAWQYLEKGAKYYVYYYKELGDLYVFHTEQLVNEIESMLACCELSDSEHGKKVKQNHGKYTTYGYAIPKDMLECCCILQLKTK